MSFQKNHQTDITQMIEEEKERLAEDKANQAVGSFVLGILASVSPEYKKVAERVMQDDPTAEIVRGILGKTLRQAIEEKAGFQKLEG
jgi:malate synthase